MNTYLHCIYEYTVYVKCTNVFSKNKMFSKDIKKTRKIRICQISFFYIQNVFSKKNCNDEREISIFIVFIVLRCYFSLLTVLTVLTVPTVYKYVHIGTFKLRKNVAVSEHMKRQSIWRLFLWCSRECDLWIKCSLVHLSTSIIPT